MNKKSNNILMGVVLFVCFVIYTVLIKVVDVQAIGPEGSSVGLASINSVFVRVFPFNATWYSITEYLGYIAIGVCLGFGLLGLFQLIKGKSLKTVDKELWLLAGFYVVVIAFYALFEVVEINYRPVILEEGLEASYPSSHTVLAICVFLSAVYEFESYLLKSKVVKNLLQTLFIVLALLTVIGRMLAGVHWFTDIIGGLILSLSLVVIFTGLRNRLLQK